MNTDHKSNHYQSDTHNADHGGDVFAAKMEEDFAELSQLQDNKLDKILTFVRDKPLFSMAVSLFTGALVMSLFSSKKK